MQIIDDFLSKDNFDLIKNSTINCKFPLYYNHYVNPHDKNNFYFCHIFYEDNFSKSGYINLIMPILEKLKAKSLIRAKLNCFPKTEKLIVYAEHCDFDFSHKGAILYLNDCDGGTYVGEKFIQSKENRIILFDSSKKHSSTNCTNQRCRFNININYF